MRPTAVAFTAMALVSSVCAQAPAGLTAGPVRITSTLPTGIGPDTIARAVAEKLQGRWDKAVVVDLKPGRAGVVAINVVKAAPPTGNDLVVADVGNLVVSPLIFKKLANDSEKDLVPVAVLYKTAFFVTVGADSPYRTPGDLMQVATDRRRTLSYGSNAVGSPIHLSSARLEHALGATMMHVPYKETSQLYAEVSTGEVDWSYGSIATAGPLARAGKLRLFAVADIGRSPAAPEVPTLEEAGGPMGISTLSPVALMAPRGTLTHTVDGINKAVTYALAMVEVRQRLNNFGFVASPSPAQQVANLMGIDRARYAEVLRNVKVSID